MVNVQTPLIGLNFDPEEAVYVGHLERTLAAYAVREAKFRALLEMLTDETWDDVELDIDNAGPQLMTLAEDTLVMRGLDRTKARTLVLQRWNKTNKSLEDVSANIRTPTAVPADSEEALTSKPAAFDFDASAALQAYRERKAEIASE